MTSTPLVDACLAGVWVDWMLRIIGEAAREKAEIELLAQTKEIG